MGDFGVHVKSSSFWVVTCWDSDFLVLGIPMRFCNLCFQRCVFKYVIPSVSQSELSMLNSESQNWKFYILNAGFWHSGFRILTFWILSFRILHSEFQNSEFLHPEIIYPGSATILQSASWIWQDPTMDEDASGRRLARTRRGDEERPKSHLVYPLDMEAAPGPSQALHNARLHSENNRCCEARVIAREIWPKKKIRL